MPCLLTSSRIWQTSTLTLIQVQLPLLSLSRHAVEGRVESLSLCSQAGREIWEQTRGRVSAFICGAGTGGTIAGVSNYLKARQPSVRVFLVDPPGSSLHNKVLDRHARLHPGACPSERMAHPGSDNMQVVRGVLYTSEESEGKRQKNPFDTITEGVGQNRLTANFAKAQVDGSFQCSDQEAIDMVRQLARDSSWAHCPRCFHAKASCKLLNAEAALLSCRQPRCSEQKACSSAAARPSTVSEPLKLLPRWGLAIRLSPSSVTPGNDT